MNCSTLSIKDIEEKSKYFAHEIEKEFHPDIVVYVAKAGFLLGYYISQELNVPLIGISTVREKGNALKNIVAPVMRVFPSFVRNILIYIELQSGVHNTNSAREIRFIDEVDDYIEKTKILIVDDSIDTGASMLAARKAIEGRFLNAEIRIAGLNVWDKSEEVIKSDFNIYRNTIIRSPMSKDSKEYQEFLSMYNLYNNGREKNEINFVQNKA